VSAGRAHLLEQLAGVAAQKVGLGRRPALDEREALVQHGDASLGLGVMPVGCREAKALWLTSSIWLSLLGSFGEPARERVQA